MKKKSLLLACVALFLVIFGASVLYKNLRKDMETPGLAAVQTTAPATEATETVPMEIPAETNAVTEAPETTEEPDYSAPNFSMETWDGQVVRLADYFGKPIILNFWASWCGPCKSEMPEFEEAYQKYGEDIHFIMLNCTISDAKGDAKALIEENGYTFPVYFDTTGEASYTYGASSIPMTIFIDANGDLVTYGVGALSADMLQRGISYIYTEE